MPQGRAHRYTHLIMLQGQVSTGQTQMQSRVQRTCNIFKITTQAQGQTRAAKLGSTQGRCTVTTNYMQEATKTNQ